MALETLKGVKHLGEAHIMTNDERPKKEDGSVDWDSFDKMRKVQPICVDHETNMISFKIQNGPIKENGRNGCQVADMIAVAKHIIEELDKKFPSAENHNTLNHLSKALKWQDMRTQRRISSGIEGTSQELPVDIAGFVDITEKCVDELNRVAAGDFQSSELSVKAFLEKFGLLDRSYYERMTGGASVKS